MNRSLTSLRLFVALVGPLMALPMIVPPALAQTGQTTASALDALFGQLRQAPDDSAAQIIANRIWLVWTTPEDPALATQMQQVLALRQRADFDGVLTLLDQIVVDYPTYAEAWNQRATIHYLLSDYAKSLADIDKVLEFEPRHFGALVGRAVIYKNQGKDDLALADMRAALAIHPFLRERILFPELKSLINA